MFSIHSRLTHSKLLHYPSPFGNLFECPSDVQQADASNTSFAGRCNYAGMSSNCVQLVYEPIHLKANITVSTAVQILLLLTLEFERMRIGEYFAYLVVSGWTSEFLRNGVN
ncbi:hypothetical protein V1477_011360 [Vespula maculifrons]|uniref:Uncharacterized protein n=2 Tax=Vespula TaxID=7451 RepID=A0A834NDF5_VESVU|nr:hypothetical protein HZH66_003821 [Vespula vulgaris]